ncbi:RRXRR domain-containing protein [Selenomonas montiformis]|uniref:RRXRR domain-containing protein n=1 Tax=Selenomonas montiformis TaxID=2652285 RepID=UPI003F8BB90F
MSAVYIISKNGERLMPTVRYGHVRHLLKDGKAIVFSRHPFTVQLTQKWRESPRL